MKTNRKSGILMHPTSFAGVDGIGTIGKQSYKFVDWLKSAGQSLWQILPLGPTGYGDSPYASFSTFAGNPFLIDLDLLVEKGFAQSDDITPPDYIKKDGDVDFGSVVYWKLPVLNKCAQFFLEKISKVENSKNSLSKNCENSCDEKFSLDKKSYEEFVKENKSWLDDYSTFMSIKSVYDKKASEEELFGTQTLWFNYWPKELSSYDKDAISKWKKTHKNEIDVIKVIQFFFFTQWKALKSYANENGILIIGDIPIFVAADSSDVWANQKLFQLDETGKPKNVAGVPPDYFSATGQLWGNPLYDWDEMKKSKYGWWVNRISHVLKLVDYVRIDHFRGFEAYWSVPYGEETAINGKWIPGPNHDLFNAINKRLGKLPLIAEDLGVITDGVRALRDDFNFPGMKVLQFAFDKGEAGKDGMINAFLPHMYCQNCIVYTGTHDNDTTQGWLLRSDCESVKLVAEYVKGQKVLEEDALKMVQSGELCKGFVKLAFSSSANLSVVPLQDIFAIDNSARMNEPSTTGKNWKWRFDLNQLTQEKAEELKLLSTLYGRNI